LIAVAALAFILPGPLVPLEQRASDADRDTAVDILCAAVAEGRLTLAELDERVGAALSARTVCELAALIADLSGPWTPVPASASVRDWPPASPGWASRAPERWSLLQSLAAALYYPCSVLLDYPCSVFLTGARTPSARPDAALVPCQDPFAPVPVAGIAARVAARRW
jgi:hypothetical protein